MARPLRVLRREDIVFQKFLVSGVQYRIAVPLVNIAIYQVNMHAQVVLGQHFISVVFLQGSRIILDEPRRREGVCNKLQIKRYIG